MRRVQRDLVAGLVFAAFGALFAGIAFTYDLGSALRMGPGFFPVLLGCALIFLGIAIAVEGWVSADETPIGAIPWRAIAMLLAGIVFFGVSVRPLGLAPALFGATLLAAFSSRRTTLAAGLLMAFGLSAFCILVFVELLGMPIALVGPWLRF